MWRLLLLLLLLLIVDQPPNGGVSQAARDEILLAHLASVANIKFVEQLDRDQF